jgi:aspartyl-tRNA(Asn)/glutamyl-tRNA(Gln) amidotransferase subunit A
MDKNQLVRLTLVDAARLIREKRLSPITLVEGYLARIERLNPTLNAFLTVMGDEALGEARQADEAIRRGDNWGPLQGVPVAVKDLIDVAGSPTTAGSDFLREHTAREDADVILQLRAAGAIIIGKTHLHEFAIGATNVNPHYGPARNPWNQAYSPGGSSGGSAVAVAASLCAGALGTDTGGSVRLPSALCGLTGIRPCIGRVSTQGVIPMSWTLDTVGPMAHTAADVALMLDAMDGLPAKPARCTSRLEDSIDGLRLGVPVDDFFWRETDFQIAESVRIAINALADLGMQVVEVGLPIVADVLRAASVISLSDATAYHRERLETEPERFGDDVRARLEWGAKRSGVEYALARQLGREWRQMLTRLLEDNIDVLALPTTPVPAHKIEGSEGLTAARELLRFTYPFSQSNLPALSMPCGFTTGGFPIGMQLVAAEEATLLQVAHAYQQIADWHQQRPAL